MDHTDLYPFAEPLDGSETAVLCVALDRARWRFAWKTVGSTPTNCVDDTRRRR